MALIDAAHNGERSLVGDLLNGDASTPLQLFVAEQQEEFNQLFKDWKHERSINQRDPVGDTPLHAAAAQGNLMMVRYLVSLGADVNAVNFVRYLGY
jgi:ankyrin repeat protein